MSAKRRVWLVLPPAGLLILGLIILGIVLSVQSRTVAGEKKANPLAGTWSLNTPGYTETRMIFSPDYNVRIEDRTNILQGSYKIDYSYNPPRLDIIWPGAGTVKTITRFLNKNKLQLQNNELDCDRPEEFSDDSVILLRVE